VTAREQQLEPLVWECAFGHLILRRFAHVELANLRRERAIAANPVDRVVARGRRQPRPGIAWQPVGRPAPRGGRERLLGGFLGKVEVAEEADQRRKDTTPLLAEGLLDTWGASGDR
jgi:hypothetical protein